ncbi:MAG: hypothetical protein JST31_10085 [Actinobacteria bacterium]|nr:hypothetical protein [Actinomycetota bacterium]
MPRQRSSHPFAVAVVLVLAALTGAVAIGAIWANQQLLDTSSWVSSSGRMLESREVRHRVAVFLADQLVAEAEGQLSAAGQEEVAAEVVPRLRRQGTRLAERVMATPQFHQLWRQANRIGHRELVRVLDEEATSLGGNGRVVINLTPALRQLAASVGESGLAGSFGVGDLGALIEPGTARIEVLEAEELEQAQEVVRVIRELPLPATLATVALFALALLLGRARLRRALLGVGLSLAAAGVLALLARAVAGHEVVDALLSREADREAAEAAWGIATSTVVELARGAIVIGALVVVGTVLAGDSAPVLALRRALGLGHDAST